MAGVTPEGWEPVEFSELLSSVSEKAKASFGEDFPTTPDSPFGELANIFLASTKDIWDLGQEVTDTQNRDSATGIHLDHLAALVGLSRQVASGSVGNVEFTGAENITAYQNTACKDQVGNVVLSKQEITLNRANCYSSTFKVAQVQNSTEYNIVVEGIDNTITSASTADELTILTALQTSIESNTTVETVLDSEELTLKLSYQSFNNLLTTTNTTNISLDSIGGLASCEAVTIGDVSFYENTITSLITPNLGISKVNNPADFVSGRNLETDEELRLRMALREQSTGTATKPAIEASVSEISGVTSVIVLVNDTLTDDPSTGIPAKSFETFVAGGDENTIAEILWITKPVNGQTHGDVSKTIVDQNGDTQGVKFSRPNLKYAWVRVTYTINDEEVFPADGEELMSKAVVSYGENMTQGEDFEPTKFYCPLYTVQGVYISNIEIAVTDLSTDTPTYQTSKIPVDPITTLAFDTSRVPITT